LNGQKLKIYSSREIDDLKKLWGENNEVFVDGLNYETPFDDEKNWLNAEINWSN